ncbi:hypothetical protein NSTC745_04016 [Nostoc sp. DSM 114161]|jgi:hypothetical protein|uniref:hypothetical protein n=1 Tax=Nostoc sp. DSM 114161 TaxID=3440143 RepID=UPI0040460AC6
MNSVPSYKTHQQQGDCGHRTPTLRLPHSTIFGQGTLDLAVLDIHPAMLLVSIGLAETLSSLLPSSRYSIFGFDVFSILIQPIYQIAQRTQVAWAEKLPSERSQIIPVLSLWQ